MDPADLEELAACELAGRISFETWERLAQKYPEPGIKWLTHLCPGGSPLPKQMQAALLAMDEEP